jgi:hypothetical protein
VRSLVRVSGGRGALFCGRGSCWECGLWPFRSVYRFLGEFAWQFPSLGLVVLASDVFVGVVPEGEPAGFGSAPFWR